MDLMSKLKGYSAGTACRVVHRVEDLWPTFASFNGMESCNSCRGGGSRTFRAIVPLGSS